MSVTIDNPAIGNVAHASTSSLLSCGAFLIVAATILFNAGLAALNAHWGTLSPAVVGIAEVTLITSANALSLYKFDGRMAPWYVLLYIFAVFAVLRGSLTGVFEPKYFRDALIIPTFVLLGMTFAPRRLPHLVIGIHAVVLAFLVLEAFDLAAYSRLFAIREYYMDTRGYVDDDFWNAGSDLYVSAIRPDARFFDFVDLHRLSSVFLEPVSLGNYAILITAFACSSFHRLKFGTLVFLILGSLAALIGSDGRLAAVACGAIVAITLLAGWLPRYSSGLYLPIASIGAVLVSGEQSIARLEDTFVGRLDSITLFDRFDALSLLGVSNEFLTDPHSGPAVDIGLAYFTATQSIFGLLLMWLFLTFATSENTKEQVRYKHALSLYLSLGLLVSYSLLSIKTAALAWFILGALNSDRGTQQSIDCPRHG